MIEQFQFYTQHSLNDLRVNGQRTFFALLCIAAGVAAIVSLQTLGGMISNTLTGNLQQNNRSDIRFTPMSDFSDKNDVLQQGVDSGVLSADTMTFFGQQMVEYNISSDGLRTLEQWAEANYPGQIELTYRYPFVNEISVFLGSGNGTAITDLETGDVVSQVVPVVIESARYPFYDEIRTLDGTLLAEALREPTDVVLSEMAASQLKVGVGDTVRLSGATEDFTVRGIVSNSAEVKSPGEDMFNALFGYYYLDVRSVALFSSIEDPSPRARSVFLQISDATPDQVNEINTRLKEAFPYFETTTTEDLRQSYTDISKAINDLVTIMGLVSMLIGSIGIINTMQVIVRRRTIEVAVLKTVGLQANQITVLFLMEAVLMGIIGSVAGIFLGWGAVFGIRGAAERLLATDLPFQIIPSAAINGLLIGVLITTVFGFLPTLSAGQVRPGIVLRPADNLIPRAGRLRTLLSLLLIMGVLILIAQGILGNFQLAVQVIVGAFVAVAILYGWLNLMVWLVGRFLPTFGFADLKISLRQMLAGRSRAAGTLLALVVGVFSLSLITLFAQSITGLLEYALDDAAGGNIAITLTDYNQLDDVETIIQNQQGVNSYSILQSYGVTLVGLEEGDTGEVLTLEQLGSRIETVQEARREQGGVRFSFGGGEQEGQLDQGELLKTMLGTIDAHTLDSLPQNRTLDEGRSLTAADEGTPLLVLTKNTFIEDAGINVGDKLTFELEDPPGLNLLGIGENRPPQTITFEVVGIEETAIINAGFDSSAYALRSAFPPNRNPTNVTVIVDVPQAFVPELRRQMTNVPGAFVLDTAVITKLINSLLSTFTAFPSMVAVLGLIVGGVVIANSVALTTMERRREIAVMKAVGLQRERVLGMILLENSVLGMIGGLIGVGIGLVGLVVMMASLSAPGSTIPWGTALLLMLLCVVVALIAAITSAWGASGEKPLNVLRYE